MAESDVLHPNGLFNPLLRFAFTNITTEDFKSFWNSKPIVIPAGATVKLKHHLAVKLVKEMVDQIMQGEAKLDEVTFYKNNPNMMPNSYRSPKGLSIGVPAARKVWEDKIVKMLPQEPESVEFEIMKQEFIEEIKSDLQREKSTDPVPVPSATLSGSDDPTRLPTEFAELGK